MPWEGVYDYYDRLAINPETGTTAKSVNPLGQFRRVKVADDWQIMHLLVYIEVCVLWIYQCINQKIVLGSTPWICFSVIKDENLYENGNSSVIDLLMKRNFW